jgi:hypothetical protein
MTIKHKCEGKTVENKATVEKQQRSSYHENFHSDFSGWNHWIEVTYHVEKCSKCGESHVVKESEVL